MTFGQTTNNTSAQAGPNGAGLSFDNNGTATANVLVTISENAGNNINQLAEYIGHEGSHAADRQGFASYLSQQIQAAGGLNNFVGTPLETAAFRSARNASILRTEYHAYEVSAPIAQGRAH